MNSTRPPSLWFHTPKPAPGARFRLFGIPYAGGAPQMFASWVPALPAGVELVGVNLPGRGRRMAEPAFDNWKPAAQAIAHNLIREYPDHKPFAIFGHSMGGLLGFEVARALRRAGSPAPEVLFVSGCFAPHLPDPHPIHHLPEAEFLEELRLLNGIPAAVLDNRELLELFLPTLRADFVLAETYSYAPGPPLECDLTAFGGEADPIASQADVAAWRGYTARSFEMHVFPGDHFFLDTSRAQMLSIIGGALQTRHHAAGIRA